MAQRPINPTTHPPNDPNAAIAATLKAGVAASFALLLGGLIWTVGIAVRLGATPPPFARDPSSGFVHGNVLLLEAGLLTLMATPILRIITAAWLFHRGGEPRYARISLLVLLIVLASTLLSLLR